MKFFLQEQLGLRLWEEDAVLPENEPFILDSLERYHLMSRLVHKRLAGQETQQERFAMLLAEGELPHGSFGENVYRSMEEVAEGLAQDLVPLLTGRREPMEVDLIVGDFHLTGWLDSLFAEGCVRFRPARLKGHDMVQLWIEHLVFSCLDASGKQTASCHVATDTTVCFLQVDDPQAELRKLLDLYRQGLREPLHFFPEAAKAWAEAAKEERRNIEAGKVWQGGYTYRGESEDSAYRIAMRGRDPLDAGFRSLASCVFGPMLACREK